MSIVGGMGSILGLPVRGMAVSLSGADAVALVTAGASLVKTLAIAGVAIGVPLYLLRAMSSGCFTERQRVPMSTLVHVWTPSRDFIGVAENDSFKFSVEGDKLEVGLDRISRIECYGGPNRIYSIGLVDGSDYEEAIPITPEISFLSVAGKQRIKFPTTIAGPVLYGAVPQDVRELRQRLSEAITSTRAKVVQEVGEDIFAHYFQA